MEGTRGRKGSAIGRRAAQEEGQSTLEWLGVAAVVIAIVVALVVAAPGMGGSVDQGFRCLVDRVVGGGAAGCGTEVTQGAPERACVTGITTGSLSGDIRVAVVNAGAGQQVRIVEKSDGTIEVTYIDTGEVGLSLEAGAEGTLEVGDQEVGLGANASVGGTLAGESGETVIFDDMDDATAHIIDRLTDEAIEGLPPIIEQGAGIGKDLINGILGNDPPEGTPGPTHEAIDLSISGEASATAGPASAGIEAAVAGGARITQNPDGSRTIRIEASASAAASLGIPVALDVGASGKATTRLEVDLAPDGTPTTGRIVLVGQGAVDDTILPDVEDLGDLVNQLTSDLPGGEGQRSVITAELDLTDPALAEAFGDVLGAAGGLDVDGIQQAGDDVLDAIGGAGTVSIETYDITDNGLGIGGKANAGIGLGAGIRGALDTATLVDAHHIDPATGTFVPWEACLGGS